LKLNYSVQQTSKKETKLVYQESIPIYDQDSLLWETGKLHRLEGPSYSFEFRIFNISESVNQAGKTQVSLYYRWVIGFERDTE
jgi:hypothetical protein